MDNRPLIEHTTFIEVWNEIDVDNGIMLIAHFDAEHLWGIIEVRFHVSGSPYSSFCGASPHGKNGKVRELTIVNSKDYRSTIIRAQALWNENIDKWVEALNDE